MKLKINKLALLCLVSPIILGCVLIPAQSNDPFQKPYTVNIVDEHRVNLVSYKDTVVLYLENTYAFNEKVVFIEKK